jgi:CheY-like chemotaxis protein
VALTAVRGPADRRRALLAGLQTHLAKPVEPDELLAVVASLSNQQEDQRRVAIGSLLPTSQLILPKHEI